MNKTIGSIRIEQKNIFPIRVGRSAFGVQMDPVEDLNLKFHEELLSVSGLSEGTTLMVPEGTLEGLKKVIQNIVNGDSKLKWLITAVVNSSASNAMTWGNFRSTLERLLNDLQEDTRITQILAEIPGEDAERYYAGDILCVQAIWETVMRGT